MKGGDAMLATIIIYIVLIMVAKSWFDDDR